MPVNVIVPELDRITREGLVGKWFKKDGENVQKGEVLVQIETAKATVEVEAPASGILRIFKQEGSTVQAGESIASIVVPTEAHELLKTEKEIERRIEASPSAKRLAKEYGVDLSKIRGTGPSGLITKDDILAYVEKNKILQEGEIEVIPLIGWRKTMADRMSYSMRTVAHVTTFAEVDVTELVKIREKLKDAGIRISFTAFVIKAVVQALKEYPILNSSLVEDKIIVKKYYNIGVAIAREEKGLVVPVVHDADKKNLKELSENLEKLVEKARKGDLSPEDVTGGTFTITNVGMFGAIMNTPIINPPESAILGVGAIVKRPVVVNDEIVIRHVVYLCLTYDHRVIEGFPAVRFLQRVRQLLEHPDMLIDFSY